MRHYEFMLGRTMKAMYCDFLVDTATSIPLKCQVRFFMVKLGKFGRTAKTGQRSCLIPILVIGIKNKLSKQ